MNRRSRGIAIPTSWGLLFLCWALACELTSAGASLDVRAPVLAAPAGAVDDKSSAIAAPTAGDRNPRPAARDEPSASERPPLLHHAVWRARNEIIVDGQPTPLFWATGDIGIDNLAAYAELGFNTIEIVIAKPSEQTWQAAESIAQAAAEHGLYLLLTLAPPEDSLVPPAGGAPPAGGSGSALRVSPLDAGYRRAVTAYLEPIVQRGASLPGVVGWVIESVDGEKLRYDRGDLASYLLRWHGSVRGVAGAWGASLTDLRRATDSFIAALDSGKLLGIGPASLDLTRYRCQVYQDLLALWAAEIHRLDRKHVVLAGRQHSYRAAICVPGDCDGMLLGLYPGAAENDLETHNAHGIDIARRANQFAALPVLKVSAAPSGARLAEWVAQAILHGAAGIGFADWSDILARDDLRRDVRASLLVTQKLQLCPRIVAASAAILYEPFAAGGFAGDRPLYGWLTGASTTEPGQLLRALARGTAFGQIDYLSESSLQSGDLRRYGVIIAPLALSLTAADRAALARYVASGGTFVADLGVGFAQSGSLDRLPPDLEGLFGVSPAPGTRQGAVNFMAMASLPRFPSLRREMGTFGGPHPATFDPPIGHVLLSNGATPVLALWDSAPAFAGIMARQHGDGWAVYATTRLWQGWQPGNAAFDAFHRDLLGYGSPLALAQPVGIVPDNDVSAFEDGSIMLLKRVDGPASVLLRNPKGTIYRIWGGIQELHAARESVNSVLTFGRSGLQVAEPLPIAISTDAARVLVQLVDYSEEGISLALYGAASQVATPESAGVTVSPGGAGMAHMRIGRGAYVVRPGSRHEISIRQLQKTQSSMAELTVGRDGVLAFDAPANTVVTIKRAGGPH